MASLVHIRIDPDMRKEIKKVVKENLFSNESEFIRDSVRKNLEIYEKISLLRSLKNSLPREKAKKKGKSDLFREFGIE
jgi:Arc/MetJ-type ribon-helix-helix transcriptional regulator